MNKCYIIIYSIKKTGGTERAAINLANILSNLGVDVKMISILTDKTAEPYYDLNKSVDIYHLGMESISNGWSKLSWFINLYKKLKKIIDKKSTIIGTGHNINAIVSLFRINGIIVIGCEHIQKEMIPKSSQILMRLSYPFLSRLVVLSETAKNKYLSYNKHLSVIPNSLPFDIQNKRESGHCSIIMVGRIDKNKGYERAMPIFEYLKKNYPNWHINIYGDGEDKDKVNSILVTKGLCNVKICMPVKDIVNKYMDSDLMMMTSYSEAMPMVILEANSCGLPVVAYSCEGTRELIKDGYNGYIVDGDNIEEFCNRLDLLIKDKNKMDEMSQNSMDYASQFSKDAIAKKWAGILM